MPFSLVGRAALAHIINMAAKWKLRAGKLAGKLGGSVGIGVGVGVGVAPAIAPGIAFCVVPRCSLLAELI